MNTVNEGCRDCANLRFTFAAAAGSERCTLPHRCPKQVEQECRYPERTSCDDCNELGQSCPSATRWVVTVAPRWQRVLDARAKKKR